MSFPRTLPRFNLRLEASGSRGNNLARPKEDGSLVESLTSRETKVIQIYLIYEKTLKLLPTLIDYTQKYSTFSLNNTKFK